MIPPGPPSSSGARKSPRLSTKAKVAPASTPGNARGRITVRKMRKPDAPRSAEASTRLRGMCSSDAYIGRNAKGLAEGFAEVDGLVGFAVGGGPASAGYVHVHRIKHYSPIINRQLRLIIQILHVYIFRAKIDLTP